MKNFLNALLMALVISAVWHIVVAFSPDKKISGLFQVKPKYGYSWEKTNSSQGGIGIRYDSCKGKRFRIRETIAGGAAQVSGLQPNDFILEVNASSTKNWTKQQLAKNLRGEIGSSFSVLVDRSGNKIPFNVTRGRVADIDDEQRLTNAYDPASHFFWNDNKVKWCPRFLHPDFKVTASETKDEWLPLAGYKFTKQGSLKTEWEPRQLHPNFKVQASTKEGNWSPMPGYMWVNNNNDDLETKWEPGKVHPNYKAWAANKEGFWTPVIGYKFVLGDDGWTDVVWSPGQKYDKLKIASGEEKDSYKPYGGYKFVNPGVNFEVQWAPGVADPDNKNAIAGSIEGTWVLRSATTEYSIGELVLSCIIKGVAGFALQEIVGNNMISDALLSESAADGVAAAEIIFKN